MAVTAVLRSIYRVGTGPFPCPYRIVIELVAGAAAVVLAEFVTIVELLCYYLNVSVRCAVVGDEDADVPVALIIPPQKVTGGRHLAGSKLVSVMITGHCTINQPIRSCQC